MTKYTIEFTRVGYEDRKQPFVRIFVEQNTGFGITTGRIYYNLNKKSNRVEREMLRSVIKGSNFPKSGRLELVLDK